MGKSPRGARAGNGARSRDASRDPRRASRRGGLAHDPADARRFGWSRRLGVALGLLVLGTSIVLAGQALDRGRPAASPAGSPSRTATAASPAASAGASLAPRVADLPVPTLDRPAAELIASPTVELTGTLPVDAPRGDRFRLRIYVNDALVREKRLPRRSSFRLRDVPLEQGANTIVLALAGPTGEGPRSTPVTVVRDDVGPPLELLEPESGSAVHRAEITLVGRTEAGATVRVTNRANDDELDAAATDDGAFSVPLRLEIGVNQIVVVAFDAAGNRTRVNVVVTRDEGGAQVSLSVSNEVLELDALPARVTLTAYVIDERGAPVDGADVTFSLSPPGLATSTFRTTTSSGVAAWNGVRIPRDGALSGQGFATVMAVLPATGEVLQASAVFTVR